MFENLLNRAVNYFYAKFLEDEVSSAIPSTSNSQ